MEKRTCSVEEAASAIGISRAFAYQLVKRNELPVVRFGRRIVVPIAALDRYLEEHAGVAS